MFIAECYLLKLLVLNHSLSLDLRLDTCVFLLLSQIYVIFNCLVHKFHQLFWFVSDGCISCHSKSNVLTVGNYSSSKCKSTSTHNAGTHSSRVKVAYLNGSQDSRCVWKCHGLRLWQKLPDLDTKSSGCECSHTKLDEVNGVNLAELSLHAFGHLFNCFKSLFRICN